MRMNKFEILIFSHDMNYASSARQNHFQRRQRQSTRGTHFSEIVINRIQVNYMVRGDAAEKQVGEIICEVLNMNVPLGSARGLPAK